MVFFRIFTISENVFDRWWQLWSFQPFEIIAGSIQYPSAMSGVQLIWIKQSRVCPLY
ncbi:unnamed protein product [Acanthoscelides obtectus]|uniref:Uncharacterized protein n=1 Tax=Acanthoscelides obtectus TaxID=200917 RepID=A0A9P0LQE8_ACAOB|nr:unnamed protein product [Acanthoscelides obtectus]CAK1670414.1 hypothetical protein AOBTE_LOCUS27619 [Acanthoscelides obtectus]